MRKRLVVISLDALGAADLTGDITKLPTIKYAIESGVHIKEVEPIYPSLTYPSHTSIITGEYPSHHSIVNNTKIKPTKKSPETMIFISIVVYTMICFYAMFMKTFLDFWILGILVGTSQGGIQSLSRSYFSRIIPKDKTNEFFGFYNVFGKFSAILGPVIFSTMTKITGQSQMGIASLMVLFIVGGIILYRLKEPKVHL